MANLVVSCECGGRDCKLKIELPKDVVTAICRARHFIIVDGCQTLPEPGDGMVETRKGYTIWHGSAEPE